MCGPLAEQIALFLQLTFRVVATAHNLRPLGVAKSLQQYVACNFHIRPPV